MSSLITSSQRVANALLSAENTLRDWQDDIDSPRSDVDKMLAVVSDLRAWVQGHVQHDLDHHGQVINEEDFYSR